MTATIRLTTLLLFAALLLPAADSWAQPLRKKDPFDGRLVPVRAVMAFRRDIDLSRDQQRRIGALVADVQKDVAAARWQVQTAHFDLLDALDAPQIDEDKAVALAEQTIQGENKVKLLQLRLLIQVRNLLSPEQLAFLRARIADGWTRED